VTLFVEPLTVVPLNNELRDLRLQEKEEVERILRELTDRVLGEAEGLRATLETLAQIDLCVAKGRLSGRQNATAPLLEEGSRLDLKEASSRSSRPAGWCP